MIRVCAKCRKELGRDQREPVDAVTHGLCRQCAREALVEYRLHLGKERDAFVVIGTGNAANAFGYGDGR